MIKSVKVEKCDVVNLGFGSKLYKPIDITAQTCLPIVNTYRLDEVLDTSQIILINKDKVPIKPFTRFKITLNDEDDLGNVNAHKIYRYSFADHTEQVCYGTPALYKHSLSLIEITKILERKPVRNLTFTNYLDEDYLIRKTVDFSHVFSYSGAVGWGIIDTIDYGNIYRFKTPYALNESIDTNVRLNLKVTLGSSTIGLQLPHPVDMRLSEYIMIKPDGKHIDISNIDSYTFETMGKYEFRQKYTGTTGLLKDMHAEVLAIWKIDVVQELEKPHNKYTITQVIDRVLAVFKLRRSGIDEQEYVLDENLREKLDNIIAPEFNFTQKSLFDVLQEIGSCIHAIPRLIPKNIYKQTETDIEVDDMQKWNIITFDFLGNINKFNHSSYSSYSATYNGDEFSTNFISHIQNATQTNGDEYISIVEPYQDGWISSRTENPNFEISNDSACIRVTQPIDRILKLYMLNKDGKTKINLTGNVFEKSKYDFLPELSNTSNESKANSLYYTRGGTTIEGLTYSKQSSGILQDIAQLMGGNIAMENITKDTDAYIGSGKLCDMFFRIEYVPLRNFVARQYKELISDTEENTLFYNQQSNAVDIKAYGESIRGALLRTGNAEICENLYLRNYSNRPHTGDLVKNYYIYSINEEIFTNSPLKITVDLSKDYNKLNEYTGIKKNYRQSDISLNESEISNVDYQEYAIVSTRLDIQNLEQESEEKKLQILSHIENVGIKAKLIEDIANKLSNNTEYDYSPLSYGIGYFESKDGIVQSNPGPLSGGFLVPANCFPFGRSIIYSFVTKSNYAIGTTSVNPMDIDTKFGGGNYDSPIYRIEDFVPYCDKFGRASFLYLAFGSTPYNLTDNLQAKRLVGCLNYSSSGADPGEDSLINFYTHPFDVNKDSREQLGFTGQINFVTDDPNITIYPALAEFMPLCGNLKGKCCFTYFYEQPNKFTPTVAHETFLRLDNSSQAWNIEARADYKYIKISSTFTIPPNITCTGYGLTDDKNQVLVYKDFSLNHGDSTPDLYIMFRNKI